MKMMIPKRLALIATMALLSTIFHGVSFAGEADGGIRLLFTGNMRGNIYPVYG